METKKEKSKDLFIGLVLSLMGGYMDIYTFISKGNVFANVQTGNLVLLSLKIIEGNFSRAVLYLYPIIAFVMGTIISITLKEFLKTRPYNYKRIIILLEVFILCSVSLLTENQNILANMLVSFACAVQVDLFNEFKGNKYFTIMVTGNLYNFAKHACFFIFKPNNSEFGTVTFRYFMFVFCFFLGGLIGSIATIKMKQYAILVCPMMLLLVYKNHLINTK